MSDQVNQHVQKLSFRPHPLVRHRHVQTVLLALHRPGLMSIQQVAQEMILETDEGVRLQGFFSPQPSDDARGLVLLLHGWLGCASSNYNMVLGEHLYRRGYAIFRLNYRDHGDTHHLNPGIFRGDLLDEIFDAAGQVAQLEASRPFYVIGASLGGSFALRIALQHARTPIANLEHVIAINPAVNPHQATLALDSNLMYLRYFRGRWSESLKRKQASFPDRYDFSAELSAKSCMAMTEIIMPRYSPYPDAITYFRNYQVTPEMMAALTVQTTILTSIDDPIVPVNDFHDFVGVSDQLQLDIQSFGGHVGFVDVFPFRYWVTEYVEEILNRSPA